jgi:hypothetical protein
METDFQDTFQNRNVQNLHGLNEKDAIIKNFQKRMVNSSAVFRNCKAFGVKRLVTIVNSKNNAW